MNPHDVTQIIPNRTKQQHVKNTQPPKPPSVNKQLQSPLTVHFKRITTSNLTNPAPQQETLHQLFPLASQQFTPRLYSSHQANWKYSSKLPANPRNSQPSQTPKSTNLMSKQNDHQHNNQNTNSATENPLQRLNSNPWQIESMLANYPQIPQEQNAKAHKPQKPTIVANMPTQSHLTIRIKRNRQHTPQARIPQQKTSATTCPPFEKQNPRQNESVRVNYTKTPQSKRANPQTPKSNNCMQPHADTGTSKQAF
eukprot:gene2767-1752_t